MRSSGAWINCLESSEVPLHVIFNDLSTEPLAADPVAAARILNEFAEVILDKRLGPGRVLVAPCHFPQLQLSIGYSIGRWLATYSPNNREKRVLLKTLIDRRTQYGDCIPAEDSNGYECEYACGGRSAVGLSTALRAGGLALSFWTAEEWNVATITIDKSWIDGDEVRTASASVPHGCRVLHLAAHEQWLTQVRVPAPESGAQIWDARATLFPSLDFIETVEHQMKALGGSGSRLRLALRGLSDLQTYCESWNGGGFDIHAIPNASGESASTLNMYSEERRFRCPDGEYRVFDWHVKRNDLRIHFYPFPEHRRILVGYVGPHLRISSFR